MANLKAVNEVMTVKDKNSGVALITVMLLVALAAIIATQMLARLQLQIQRTTNIAFNQQAYWYAMGAEAFAKRVLITSFKDESNFTHLQQIWAQGETSYPVENGQISGEIIDLHSCLNLNALQSNEDGNGSRPTKNQAREAFERLVLSLDIEGIGSSSFEVEMLADALTDWLDSDGNLTNIGGAEDNDYAGKAHPYLAANSLMVSVNELRVIEHFTPEIIEALRPYVCILPGDSRHEININTLKSDQPQLLQALLNINRVDAETLLTDRKEEGFENIEDFFNLPSVSKLNLKDELKQQFVVDSEYFTLKASAKFNESYFAMNSIMTITNNEQVNVVSRTIGRN